MLSELGQGKKQDQTASGQSNKSKVLKVYLMEFLNRLKNEDNNTAAPAASVNILTARIKEIKEETPAATGVEVEPAKLSQELGKKKLQFLY